MTSSQWTDERVECLEQLATEGKLSASQMGRVIGVSRNAVIGLIRRKGWIWKGATERRDAAILAAGTGKKTQKEKQALIVKKSVPPPDTSSPATDENGKPFTIMTLPREGKCRWPRGNPIGENFHFCGHNVKKNLPYCEEHARKAYQPQQKRRDKS